MPEHPRAAPVERRGAAQEKEKHDGGPNSRTARDQQPDRQRQGRRHQRLSLERRQDRLDRAHHARQAVRQGRLRGDELRRLPRHRPRPLSGAVVAADLQHQARRLRGEHLGPAAQGRAELLATTTTGTGKTASAPSRSTTTTACRRTGCNALRSCDCFAAPFGFRTGRFHVRPLARTGARGCATTLPRTGTRSSTACCSASACSRSISARSLTGTIIRSLGGAGSKGLTVLGRYATGWFDYVRGDDRNTINVTLNMVVDGHLKFDTIVADRRVWNVWPNQYRVLPDPPRRQAHHARQSAHRVSANAEARAPLARRAHHRHVRQREGHRERPQPARPADARGRLPRDLRAADQPDQREVHQRRFDRSRARPPDGRAPLRHRAHLRAAQHAPRAPPARDGDLGADAAQPSRRDAARRFRGAQDALPHAAGDRARCIARIPSASAS